MEVKRKVISMEEMDVDSRGKDDDHPSSNSLF